MTLHELWGELGALAPEDFRVVDGDAQMYGPGLVITTTPVHFGLNAPYTEVLLAGPMQNWLRLRWPQSYARVLYVPLPEGGGGTWEASGTWGKWWPSPIVAVGDTQTVALAALALQFLQAEARAANPKPTRKTP